MLEQLRDAHVVVPGGAGFLGSHLCERLVDLGARGSVIDNFLTGDPDNVAQLAGRNGFRVVRGGYPRRRDPLRSPFT
jgi:nucleoside-diphosphate-sugar epimerase